jgi:hypothetical protein
MPGSLSSDALECRTPFAWRVFFMGMMRDTGTPPLREPWPQESPLLCAAFLVY